MAHFLERYIHMINSCDDYDALSDAIDTCISKNVMNHTIVELKNKIDSLELNTQYSNFVKSLVWASTVSEYNESALNILRYFTNKVVSEFDGLIVAPDDFSLMAFAICADDKSFIKKLPKEKKIILAKTICDWYLAITHKDREDNHLFGALSISMDLIIDGKTMDELDRDFKDWYRNNTIENSNIDDFRRANEVLRPFQALFINISQNIDQVTLLHQLNVTYWQNLVENRTHEIASRYVKKANNDSLYDAYYLFLHDTLVGFDILNRKLTSTGYSKLPNPIVGEFLLGFLNVLHDKYEYDNFDTKEISMLLRDAQNLYYNNFAIADSTRTLLDCIIASYCNTGDFEDSFLKGDYFESIKMHLRNSELFKAWLETADDNKYKSLPDRVYATYIHHFLNPKLETVDRLIEAQEQSLIIATEAIKSKKNAKEDLNDEPVEDDENEEDNTENEEEPEDEEEYDGPEIEAKQSTKGYSRASKLQSDGERKIYKAYKKYKNNEEKVDSQLSKMLSSAKRAFSQDKTEEIIEGKKFTPLGLLKKVLMTAAIFNFNKIAGFIYLLTSHTISKKRTTKQKNEILLAIEAELKMMDEKIEDARGDGNRKAKYALMRTKAELERARDKIKYNLTATKEDMRTAKKYISNPYKDNL